MTQEIHNPIQWSDIESGLTEAEDKFRACLEQGIACVLGGDTPKAEESGGHNTIRGEVIRFFRLRRK